jgi:hypothetical protein
MKNVQRFAGAPRGLYRSQDLFADLQVRAVYFLSEQTLQRSIFFPYYLLCALIAFPPEL